MPTSTSRLGLQQPIITPLPGDGPAEVREAISTNAGILDATVITGSGLLAGRPSSSLVVGQTYYATDTGLWYFYNGSAWQTILLTSPWQNCTLGTGVTATGSPWAQPQARLVGDMVFLRGAIHLDATNTGSILGMPGAAYVPAGDRGLVVGQSVFGGPAQSGYVNTSGTLVLPTVAGNSMSLGLDNCSYYIAST